MTTPPSDETAWADDLDGDDPLFDESIEDAPEGDLPPPEVEDGPSLVDLLVALLEAASNAVLDRPIIPRVKVSPAGLLRGEVDVVKVEVPALAASGLVIDRFVVRAEHVRFVPGLPPRLQAGPVGFKAIVSQDNVDRWTRSARLPVRLLLTPDGVVMHAGVRGVRMGEVLAELKVVGRFIQLRPRRVSLLGLPAPLARFFRGYLPLPPLPKGAHLKAVEPGDGEVAVLFEIERVDEPVTPDIARQLQRLIKLPIPGL